MNTDYKHIQANIYNFQEWISETNPEVLKTNFENLLQQSKFTLLAFNEHHFEQQGYTCFWLLGESHLAIHTFPESNKTYIELSSCNQEKLNVFKNLMQV
ncbi:MULTISPECIES: S-adenosylmethionine decarboxylase family protein [Tenacibaculum]|uniref:S-adenosylmethionine decarboxylase family protein n=1 Tax=Tenacibaculum TaxID=104267 RepID=UPI000DE804A2|nr:S-adenosylmethionine decarboxylase [Tenacibaculum sp. E3R01]RBW61320.1 spermidine synthase [Tenacibaculum sp. E3R01]